MLKRAWRPIAATTAVLGASGYLYHSYTRGTLGRPSLETFDLQVRSRAPDGSRAIMTRSFGLMSAAEVEARLRALESAQRVDRPGGLVWRYTTAQLPSNNPIEDAYASAIVQKDTRPGAPEGDLLFFSVMDGHSGRHTSQLLSRTLIPAVALELKNLMDEPSSYSSPSAANSSYIGKLKSMFSLKPTSAPSIPYDADPIYVSLAIQTAFSMLDSQIVNAPLRLLAEHLRGTPSKDLPDLTQHPMALASMLPALSGSCALLALLDTARRDLYVACTGDCRAVAGIWEEDADGNGRWRVEALSEDQTGRNPKELLRMQSEHPENEAAHVIQRGRVLGGLEPSRAFGDSRYKWPAELQTILQRVFLSGSDAPMRGVPPNLKTPPYVTAQPVITHRKLNFLPLEGADTPADSLSSSSSAPGAPAKPPTLVPRSSLRFLVLATDGLWDELSSADVVSLVGAHLSGTRGTSVPKNSLPTPVLSSDALTVEGKDTRKSSSTDGAWAFVDENVSTHLIRNAFGGADTGRLRRLLSIPAPLSRSYRDDVTVTVVWWEDGRAGAEVKEETFKVEHKESAKL